MTLRKTPSASGVREDVQVHACCQDSSLSALVAQGTCHPHHRFSGDPTEGEFPYGKEISRCRPNEIGPVPEIEGVARLQTAAGYVSVHPDHRNGRELGRVLQHPGQIVCAHGKAGRFDLVEFREGPEEGLTVADQTLVVLGHLGCLANQLLLLRLQLESSEFPIGIPEKPEGRDEREKDEDQQSNLKVPGADIGHADLLPGVSTVQSETGETPRRSPRPPGKWTLQSCRGR